MEKYLRVQRSLFFTILLAVGSKAIIVADERADTQDKKVASQEKNIVNARDTAALDAVSISSGAFRK